MMSLKKSIGTNENVVGNDKYAVRRDFSSKLLKIEVENGNKRYGTYTEEEVRNRLFLKERIKQLQLLSLGTKSKFKQVLIDLINHYISSGLDSLVINGFQHSQTSNKLIFHKNNRKTKIKELELDNLSFVILEQFKNCFSEIKFLLIGRAYGNFRTVSKVLVFNRITRLEVLNEWKHPEPSLLEKNLFFRTVSVVKNLKYLYIHPILEEFLFPRPRMTFKFPKSSKIKYDFPMRDIFIKYNHGSMQLKLYFLKLPSTEVNMKITLPFKSMDVFELKRVMTRIERADVRGNHVLFVDKKIFIKESFLTPNEFFDMVDPSRPLVINPLLNVPTYVWP